MEVQRGHRPFLFYDFLLLFLFCSIPYFIILGVSFLFLCTNYCGFCLSRFVSYF